MRECISCSSGKGPVFRLIRMDRAMLPRQPRGHEEDRANMSWRGGEQWIDDQAPLPWKGSATRFAPIVGLVLVLIAACASAFSMLLWEPAAGPPASVTPIVDSSKSGEVLPGRTRRVMNSAGGREGRSLCSLIRVQKKGRWSEKTWHHRWNRHPPVLSWC